MTELVERAQAREQELRDDALRDQARRADLAGKTLADSALVCCMCGEPIPEGRRMAQLGVKTCVECKTLSEQTGHRGSAA